MIKSVIKFLPYYKCLLYVEWCIVLSMLIVILFDPFISQEMNTKFLLWCRHSAFEMTTCFKEKYNVFSTHIVKFYSPVKYCYYSCYKNVLEMEHG